MNLFPLEVEFPVEFELPNLSDERCLAVDTETSGLKMYGKDKPVGFSVSLFDYSKGWYFPFGHNDGFNYELDALKLWIKDNLAGKHLYFKNAKFDLQMFLNVGIDLEALGCIPHEIANAAVLLFPWREDFSLNGLALEDLGKKKVELKGNFDDFPMQDRNSAAVAWYAIYDAMLTAELAHKYEPMIIEKKLTKVWELEDRLIYPISSMQRLGVKVDIQKLEIWEKQIQQQITRNLMEIYRIVGFRVEPTRPYSLARLFNHLNIPYHETATGKPSFTGEFLEKHLNIPEISLCYDTMKLLSLESKYISKYLKATDSNNRIRYSLNQLKAITGRFSSSSGGKAIEGINIQQVFDDEKQGKIPAIADYPIRDLMIPDFGNWLCADAMQIEFRIFAHFSKIMLNSDRLVNAYKENPMVDFHDHIAKNIMHRPRKITKSLNFGKIYGLGIKKLADIYLHCSYDEAKAISNHYNREFPEAGQLLDRASTLARSRDTGNPLNRGWVRTMMGRMRTFTNADLKKNPETGEESIPWYAALNAVIQGTAADIMKIKIIDLYESRKETGFQMQLTVHDEVDGSVPDIESARKVKEILDAPAFDQLTVPILWQVAIGETWATVEDINA